MHLAALTALVCSASSFFAPARSPQSPPPFMSADADTGSIPLPLSMMEGTNLGGKTLMRCFKANFDGWSALDFHRQVDELGSVVIVGQLKSGALIGGYNPVGYESVDDYRATPRAFVFCAAAGTRGGGEDEASRAWQQCAALGPGEIAIFDNARGGPQFGAGDLVIGAPQSPVMGGFAGPDTMDDTRTAGDLRSVSARLGGSFAKLPSGSSFPTGELVDLEAYCNAAVVEKPQAWNAGPAARKSQAPPLLIATAVPEATSTASEDADGEGIQKQSVGWWPW
jgi:hypothetical protein